MSETNPPADLAERRERWEARLRDIPGWSSGQVRIRDAATVGMALADEERTDGEAQRGEAHPSRYRWRTEVLDDTEWVANSTYFDNAADALAYQEDLARRHPTWSMDDTPIERRLVREETTFTVEQPATEA